MALPALDEDAAPAQDPAPVAAARPAAREIIRAKPLVQVDENWNVIEPGSEADTEAAAEPAPATRHSRRNLLPDIESIRTSLGEASERPRPEIEEPLIMGPGRRRQKRGFRFSFTLVLFVGLALLALYGLAPTVSAQVPALDPALKIYVSLVDQARVLVDAWMQQLLELLKEKTAA